MKFKAQVADLVAALDVVSIVPPGSLTQEGGTGYLFVVADDKCFVYSKDAQRVVRAEFPVTDVEDEGSLVYPGDATAMAPLRFLSGEITVESGHEEEGDRHYVKYQVGEAQSERSTYDPRYASTFDKALAEANTEFEMPAAILKESLQMAKPYVGKLNSEQVEEVYKTVRLFDDSDEKFAKGDGNMYAADNVCAFYFFCEALKGKGVSVYGQHMSFVLSFLSKCGETVKVRNGKLMTYLINEEGQVLGWSHCQKNHERFKYPSRKNDQFVLRMPQTVLLTALSFVRAEMGTKQSKIRVEYNHVEGALRFRGSGSSNKVESFPVGVSPIVDEDGKGGGVDGPEKDFALNANVNHLIELVENSKAHEVELRVCVSDQKGKSVAFFRTIDQFLMDTKGKVVTEPKGSHPCMVSRFATTQN